MAAATSQPKAWKKPWPKVHLVYFFLAAFDLIAVVGGLFLTHQVIAVFRSNVEANAEWDGRLMAAWTMMETSMDANATVLSALEAAATGGAQVQFRSKLVEFRRETQHFRSYVDSRFPEGAARRAKAILARIDLIIASIETEGQRVFDLLAENAREEAVDAASQMQRRQTNLRFQIKDLNRLVGMVKLGRSEHNTQVVAELRRYEYAIGGAIALMVCGIALYGHWIGHLMRRKYEEVQAAHEEAESFARELAAVNEGVVTLNAELADTVRSLREAQDENIRRGKLAQLGQLTATVAHELRNPLSAVRNSAYLIERRTRGKDLGFEPQLDRINAGILRCDSIIAQLLDFARSQELQREPVALDEWLEKLVAEEAQKLPREVSVVCEFGLEDARVAMDPQRMARVIINLLANASEALVGKGGDASKRTTPEPRIVVSTRLTGRGVEVTVADNGPGIPPENLEKILQPLFTTKSFGTGLGLPAVEKVLQMHGGGLAVDSAPGEGARFTAWFPVSPPVRAAA